MVDFGYAVVGIILVLIVVGGLLYILYARTNAVIKTGYGSLIMLGLVSAMIPVFWILQNSQQATAVQDQQALAIQRGMQLYAQNCVDRCYGIDSKSNVVNPTYLGYTFTYLNSNISDDMALKRIISAGIYNPSPTPPVPTAPANANAIPRAEQYGGQLQPIYVDYLTAFIRSTDPNYARKNGFTGDAAQSGLKLLPDYLQANMPNQYKAATQFASVLQTGQFGPAKDMTAQKAITINMVEPPPGATCTPSCFEVLNVKVKVGTVITWVNKTNLPHTVTAKDSRGQPASQVFDSGATNYIQSGKSFQFTVNQAAYNLNSDHTVVYYCRIHPQMMAELTIVPS